MDIEGKVHNEDVLTSSQYEHARSTSRVVEYKNYTIQIYLTFVYFLIRFFLIDSNTPIIKIYLYVY